MQPERLQMQSQIEELVKRSLEDQSYTLYLWEKMKPLCLKWAHKLGHIEGDREDLYQESYILLIRALRCYEVCQNMSFEAYFKMVLYRWGRDYKCRKRPELMKESSEAYFWESQVDEGQQVEESIIGKERATYLIKGLESLSEFEYNLLVDFYIRELKIGDIASSHHMNYKALESRKRRILKKLRERMTQFESSSVYIEYKQPVLRKN